MFTIFLHGLGIITCSGSMKILLFLSYQLLLQMRNIGKSQYLHTGCGVQAYY